MCTTARVACFAFIFSMLSGCAGKDFVRPNTDTVKLGQTSYSQIVGQMGEPKRSGDILVNGKNVKSITYVYAASMGEPLEDGVIPARALSYYFHNDSLVGQEFISSFKSDHSNFDETKVESVRKGQTTREEVAQILGKPTGSFIPPMVKATAGEAYGYAYQTTRGGVFSGFKFFQKILKVSFDDKGVVSDIEFTSTGTK